MPEVPRKPRDGSTRCIEPPKPPQRPVLAVDLGHHRLRVGAERDRIAVAAVGREHLVAVAQRRERSDDRRLGAVGEVRVAADRAGVLLERALDALLELPDPQHLRVDPDQPVPVEPGVSVLAAHLRAPFMPRHRRGMRRRRLVGPSEDLVDRAVAQVLGEHLDAPGPGVAVARGRPRRSRGCRTRPRRAAGDG